MRRREFIGLLGGAVASWPGVVRAQAEPMRRIGVLMGFAEGDREGQSFVILAGSKAETFASSGVGLRQTIPHRSRASQMNSLPSSLILSCHTARQLRQRC
jgi:hypothetical protein